MALDSISIPFQQDSTTWKNPLWEGTLDTITPSDQVQKLRSTMNELRWNTNMGLTSFGEVPTLYSYSHRAHDYKQPSPTPSTLESKLASVPTRSLSGTTIAPSIRSSSRATIEWADNQVSFKEPQYPVDLPDELPLLSENAATQNMTHGMNDDVEQQQRRRHNDEDSETAYDSLSHRIRTNFDEYVNEPLSPLSTSPSPSMILTLPDATEIEFREQNNEQSNISTRKRSHSRSVCIKKRGQEHIEVPGIDEGFWQLPTSSITNTIQKNTQVSSENRPNDLIAQMVNCGLSQDERRFISLLTGSRLRSRSSSNKTDTSQCWKYNGRDVIPQDDILGQLAKSAFDASMEYRTNMRKPVDSYTRMFNQCCTVQGSEMYNRLKELKGKVSMYDTMDNQILPVVHGEVNSRSKELEDGERPSYDNVVKDRFVNGGGFDLIDSNYITVIHNPQEYTSSTSTSTSSHSIDHDGLNPSSRRKGRGFLSRPILTVKEARSHSKTCSDAIALTLQKR
ncbi:hypothetical protein I204_04344 [Kwoniella mangroviensis CBS 8886]|nr:hypothetical protein I204_04344 [Kwoniella mangroviensis CBS 8886]